MQQQPPEVWDTGKGLTARYGGRLLYSGVEPARGVMRRLDAAVAQGIASRSLVFVPSLGLGLGLSELIARTPPDSHVLCVETDQLLFATACRLEPRLFPEHPRLTVVRGDDPTAVARMAHQLGLGRFRRLITVALCSGYEADKARYDLIAAALRDAIRVHWQNHMTLVRMGRLWIRNLLANLAVLPRAADWTELRDESPIVVVGAGPSLELRLDWIAAHRSKVRVLAVDTALPVLADAGLRPDIVFALEAQWVNLEDFLGSDLDRCRLIADITATPSLLRRVCRPYLCASLFHPVGLLSRLREAGLSPGVLPPLGSVGVAALYVAFRLTPAAVLATGLDFAYSGRKSHARGAPAMRAAWTRATRLAPADSAGAAALLGRRLMRVADKHGGSCLSDFVLQGYAAEAARIAGAPPAAGRLIDLDAGGLTKGGQPLDEGLPRGWAAVEPRAEAAAAGWSREGVLRFVAAERDRLDRAAGRVERLLEAGGELDPEASVLLREVDYLYLHFPDTTPLPNASRSFLARLASSAADARPWWQQCEQVIRAETGAP